ncbi:hypothetical protein PoB_006919900 [Plakobranchus ocellatus]|uniref:Uncharacterized protein n=1 Tax=Plakobranchus ocellatus TaxID=259542 RepID=A0AAV4DER0_9GAST|nr:hypothetical protein PoB_006919900 [Plakobranchus ocellatus]
MALPLLIPAIEISFVQQGPQQGVGHPSSNEAANERRVVIADIATSLSPQQGDFRLSGPPSGQGAGGGARTRDRRVPADLRADSLATVPPTP